MRHRMTVRPAVDDGPSKLGPRVSHSKTDRTSCPPSCPLWGAGCFGENFPLSRHWERLNSGRNGGTFAEGLAQIQALPAGSLFRHNVVGDLPGAGETVDTVAALELAEATRHLVSWTYTHKRDGDAIRAINAVGTIVVNVSTDTLAEADDAINAGLPVVTVRPVGAPIRGERTPQGLPVYTCPAAIPGAESTCSTCGNGSPLCARRDRGYVIAFPAHGSRKNAVGAR